MKYKTVSDFVKAVQAGKFNGVAIVGNDCVHAYANGGEDLVCNFDDEGPEGALIAVLEALGANAERP